MLRCCICNRALLRPALPGLMIGPTCAKRRGLLGAPGTPKVRIVSPLRRRTAETQLDWIDQLARTG